MLQMDKIDQSFNVFSLFCEIKTRPGCCAMQFVIISWTSVSTTLLCIFFSAWMVSDGQLTLLLARRLQKYVIHAETLEDSLSGFVCRLHGMMMSNGMFLSEVLKDYSVLIRHFRFRKKNIFYIRFSLIYKPFIIYIFVSLYYSFDRLV